MNTGHRTDFTDTELSAWLDGEGDSLPEGAFMYGGSLDDAKAKAEKMKG